MGGWGVALILKLLLPLVLAGVTGYFLYDLLKGESKRRRAHRMRQEKPSSKERTVLRRTDLVKLTRGQESLRQKAFDLVNAGKVKEGAQLLESLDLIREAVNVLEEAQLIEEACAILIRIQRPIRAAAVYARHGMHAKAAEIQLSLGQKADAAKQFVEAGKKDPAMAEKAGQLFEGLHLETEALAAYALAGNVGKVSEYAFRNKTLMALVEFLEKDSRWRKNFFETHKSAQIKELVVAMPVDPVSVERMGRWSEEVHNTDFIVACLRKLTMLPEPLSVYWAKLSNPLAIQIVNGIVRTVKPDKPESLTFLTRHAHALFKVHKYESAMELYGYAGRLTMAAKCAAMLGDVGKCIDCLKGADERGLAARCEKAVELGRELSFASETGRGRWSQTVIEDVCRVMESVDPENDDQAVMSPFSLGP